MSLITSHLFLGNIDDALNRKFLKTIQCDTIVNCSKDLPYCENYRCTRKRISVHDDLKDQSISFMSYALLEIIPYLYEVHSNKKTILVHCAAGMQRSAIVVLCLLVYIQYKNKYGNTKRQPANGEIKTWCNNSLKLMFNRRPIVFNYGRNMNFKKAAESFFAIMHKL